MLADSFYRRPLPDHLISFSSSEGRGLFREALAAGTMEGYFPLAEQFHTQGEPAFCGLGRFRAQALLSGAMLVVQMQVQAPGAVDAALPEVAVLAADRSGVQALQAPAGAPPAAACLRRMVETAARGFSAVAGVDPEMQSVLLKHAEAESAAAQACAMEDPRTRATAERLSAAMKQARQQFDQAAREWQKK